MAWTSVRTVDAAVPEAAPSDASAFVPIPSPVFNRVKYVEVGFDAVSVANAPTDVTLAIWRLSDGEIDRVGSVTFTAAEITAKDLESPILDFQGEAIWATVESFTGGASPTFSGALRAREVSL